MQVKKETKAFYNMLRKDLWIHLDKGWFLLKMSLIQFVHTERKSLKGSSPLDIVAFLRAI